MPDQTAVDRIPIAHSVRYAAGGLPNVPNQYGPGVLAPSEITLTYRAAPDSQLGRVHAYVAGRIWVDGTELPLLPGGLYGQHYDDGLDGWPAWLADEARLHDPAVPVPATDEASEPDDTDLTEADVDRMMAAGTPVQIVTGPPATYGATPATAQTALRDRIAEALADALKPRYGGPQHNTPGGLPLTATAEEIRLHRAQPLADAVLSVLPASVDRAAADLATARDTNRRLNLRAQRLESELAAYRRAVGQWEISDRGTYIPHSSLRAIGLASGKDILGSVRHLKHFERVEQAEARLSRIREWVTSNVVTARNEFGSGYREAQRDIRDLLDGRPTEAAVGAQQPKENQP